HAGRSRQFNKRLHAFIAPCGFDIQLLHRRRSVAQPCGDGVKTGQYLLGGHDFPCWDTAGILSRSLIASCAWFWPLLLPPWPPVLPPRDARAQCLSSPLAWPALLS